VHQSGTRREGYVPFLSCGVGDGAGKAGKFRTPYFTATARLSRNKADKTLPILLAIAGHRPTVQRRLAGTVGVNHSQILRQKLPADHLGQNRLRVACIKGLI
jgi:hypothetical protein